MSNLNRTQFPKAGDTRIIDGQPHHFAGWHATDRPDFKPDPNHESFDDALGVGPGHLYTTHDPNYWAKFMGGRTHVAEVWQRTKSPEDWQRQYGHVVSSPKVLDAWHKQQFEPPYHTADEDALPLDEVRVGRVHEFNKALQKHTFRKEPWED